MIIRWPISWLVYQWRHFTTSRDSMWTTFTTSFFKLFPVMVIINVIRFPRQPFPATPPSPVAPVSYAGTHRFSPSPLPFIHPASSPVFTGSSFPLFDFPRASANFSCITEGGWSETAGIWGQNEFTISCICSHSNQGRLTPSLVSSAFHIWIIRSKLFSFLA